MMCMELDERIKDIATSHMMLYLSYTAVVTVTLSAVILIMIAAM